MPVMKENPKTGTLVRHKDKSGGRLVGKASFGPVDPDTGGK